jgi:multisubunit Na+/H+ antiporter MnhB subunit
MEVEGPPQGEAPVPEGLPEPVLEPAAEALPEPVLEPAAQALPEPVLEPAAEALPEPVLGPAAKAVDARPARAPAGELTSALCALALLLLMVATRWYGVVALPRSADRSGVQSAASAWSELTTLRWLMLGCVAITLGSVALHISQRSHGSQTDTSVAVTSVGTLTAALLFYRVVVKLPAPSSVVDAKLGAFLGVLAAAGIGLGGVQSVLDGRRRRRRRQTRIPRTSTLTSTPRGR